MANEDNNKSRVLAYQMAVSGMLNDGVDADLSEHLAADITWYLPASLADHGGARFHGIEGVRRMLTDNLQRFYRPDSLEVDFRSMISEGDLVHLHFGLQAITPSGQPYQNDYQILYQLSEQGIINVWEYFDAHQLIETLTPSASMAVE